MPDTQSELVKCQPLLRAGHVVVTSHLKPRRVLDRTRGRYVNKEKVGLTFHREPPRELAEPQPNTLVGSKGRKLQSSVHQGHPGCRNPQGTQPGPSQNHL